MHDWNELRYVYRHSFLVNPEYELLQLRALHERDKANHPDEFEPIRLTTFYGSEPLTVETMMAMVNRRWDG